VGEGVLAGDEAAVGFTRAAGALRCEGVAADAIAAAVGTPAYVYSAGYVRDRYRRLDGALHGVRHRLHYSVKANSNLALLALLRELGAGVDIVSGGELFRALRAGYAGQDVVFSGVGKTEQEIREALEAEIFLFNVESAGELALIERTAARLDVVAPVAFRVNPEVLVDTPHHYTRTGERGNKFGVPFDEVLAVALESRAMPHVRVVGLDMHIGSQVQRVEPYRDGLARLLVLVAELREHGFEHLRLLDIGGGLAVTYEEEVESDLAHFGEFVTPVVAAAGLELIMEPGRYVVGNAGVLLTRVLYRKRSGGKEFVITDAGMTELLRPSHYNAYHRIDAVVPRGGRSVVNVVGPVCESGDFFALDREMDDVQPGDLVAVHSAGAYGFVMASNYNSRPRPPEVLVDGDRYRVVTERERYEDLVARERPDAEWRAG
jgi:diaminopimelate decarboxylase